MGHGHEDDGRMFCCAHCAREYGVTGVADRSARSSAPALARDGGAVLDRPGGHRARASMRDRTLGLVGLVGALWGLGGYAALWGLTPVVVHRSFVVSAVGTAVLLPVRLVLWGIRGVEGLAGRPFELASRTEWIGLLAAVVGALLATSIFALGRGAVRRLRRPRTAG